MDILATKEALAQFLASATYVEHYGFEVESCAPGECTLRYGYNPRIDRPGGMVSGPVFPTIAAVAMWLAIMTRLGIATGQQALMTSLNTTFLGSCHKQGFRCTARILKLGRGTIYGTAECASEDGQVLAHHTISYTNPTAAR